VTQRIALLTERLSAAWKMAELAHPDRPLERGYARVTARDGGVITSAAAARAAERFTLNFSDGPVDAEAVSGARKVERRPKPKYSAPQPGLFDAPEE
jgi:exodeoxyribonuclease VII large subunit